MLFSFLSHVFQGKAVRRPARGPRSRTKPRPRTRPLTVELLEERTVLSSSSAAGAAYGHLPLAFELNRGQAPAGINYVAQSGLTSLDLTAQAAVLKMGQQPGSDVLTLGLAGANPAAPAVGLDRLITRTNYLIGSDRSQWHTNIPNFGRVEYQNVYPGIDVAY